MPELPEVENICQNLNKHLGTRTIEQVMVRHHSLRLPIPHDLAAIFKHCIIKRIYRRAKYLIINCADKTRNNMLNLIVHLGMSGRLSLVDHTIPVNKHDHVDFVLDHSKILRYTDPRRFGLILWTKDDPLQHILLKKLGLEPFDNLLDAAYLLQKAKITKKITIKQFIMNHKIIVGVGNIYANEALFISRINPRSLAKNLELNDLQRLLTAIKEVLTQAILKGGTTLKDFFLPNGKKGEFVDALQVYGKSNQPCIRCSTKIIHVMLGQRSTFYCTNCQVN